MSSELKYDRQLRLWANSGQTNLENSRVCLVNASTLGSESLKNLVLPGIGSFTIIDDKLVNEDDVSNGFFLEDEDIGVSISTAMVARLQELNPGVKGTAIEKSLDQLLLAPELSIWSTFTIVILTNRHLVPSASLESLKNILWDLNIPLLIADTMGFYGYLNIVCREINVIETHPELLIDLRIDQPWPELLSYVDSIDLDSLDGTDHAHVPYVVILIKALQQWKQKSGGVAPQNYQEKKHFKEEIIVKSLSRDFVNEANFEEAYNNAWRASQETNIPSHVRELLVQSENCNTTDIFWVFVTALRLFLSKNNNILPLSGVLPDMASDTPRYVALQNIYREKAKVDQSVLAKEIRDILNESESSCLDSASIDTFCKNCRFLYLTRGSRANFNKEMQDLVTSGSDGIISIYFAMLEYGEFMEKYHTEPTLVNIADFSPILTEKNSKTVQEVIIHSSKLYHNVASFMGGIIGQESLKLVTKQYRPLDNLYVYDGVHSVSEKWKI